MNTLAEIEQATERLSVEEKEELLRFLAMRLREERSQAQLRRYSQTELEEMVAEDEADGATLRSSRDEFVP